MFLASMWRQNILLGISLFYFVLHCIIGKGGAWGICFAVALGQCLHCPLYLFFPRFYYFFEFLSATIELYLYNIWSRKAEESIRKKASKYLCLKGGSVISMCNTFVYFFQSERTTIFKLPQNWLLNIFITEIFLLFRIFSANCLWGLSWNILTFSR